MMKRSLALALCLCLTLSLMTAAFAATPAVGQFSDKATATGAVMNGSFNATHSYIITEDDSGLLTAETTWTVGSGTVTYTPDAANTANYTLTLSGVNDSGLSICLNTASGASDITVDVEGECVIGELISNDADGNATVTLKGNLTVSAIQAHATTATKSFTVDNNAKLTISSAQASAIDTLTLNPYSQMTTAGAATVTIEKYFKGESAKTSDQSGIKGTGPQLTVGEGTTLNFDNNAYLNMDGVLTVNGTFVVKNNMLDATQLNNLGAVTIGPNGEVFNEAYDGTRTQHIYIGGTPPFISASSGGTVTINNETYTLGGAYPAGGLNNATGPTLYLAGSGYILYNTNSNTVTLNNAALTHPLTLPADVKELHLVRDTTSTITVSDTTATALYASGDLTIRSTGGRYASGVLRIIGPENKLNTGIHVGGGLTIDGASVTVGYYSNDFGVAQNINPAYAVKAASLTVENKGGLSAYATEECIDITGAITVRSGALINAHYAAPYDQTAATIQANSLAVESGAGVGAYWGGLAVTGDVSVTGAGSHITASSERGPGIKAQTVKVKDGARMERVKGTTGIQADTVTIDSTREANGKLALIWGTAGPAIRAKTATLGAKDTVVVVAGTPAGVIADTVIVNGALSAEENKTYTGTYPDDVGRGVAVKSSNVIVDVANGAYINFTPTITLSYTEHACTGGELKPAVTVMDGERVLAPGYYTVSYENNIDNLNNQPAKVTVTATNGYRFDPIGVPTGPTEEEPIVNTPYTLTFTITGTPPAGGNNGGGSGAIIQSPKTFDAGIALYAGLALSATLGAVYVGKKFSLDK